MLCAVLHFHLEIELRSLMAFSAVINRATGAVRAYFLRDLDEPIMGVVSIPPVAVPVMRMVYLLLSVFFANSALAFYFEGCLIVAMVLGSSMSYMLIYLVAPKRLDKRIPLLHTIAYLGPWVITHVLGIDSGLLCDGLWIISVGLCCLWAAMKWEYGFIKFYLCGLSLCITLMLISAITASCDKVCMYNGVIMFLTYMPVYGDVMIRRIVKGDTDYVNHVVSLFSDLPYVYFRFGRITLRDARDVFLMIKARIGTVNK